MASLALRHCSPLKKGTTPIRESLAHSLMAQLDSAWHLAKDKKSIAREYLFSDFHQTIGFVNALAWIANQEHHHPDLEVSYKRCLVRFTSHTAKGLTVNDFICAAKTDIIYTGSVPAEQTTGKTRPAPETGETPARQDTPKPSATSGTSTPALNVEEASALLDQTIKPSSDDKDQKADDDEDEFELIDPAEQLRAQARAEAADEQTQQQPPEQPAIQPEQPEKSEPEQSKPQTPAGPKPRPDADKPAAKAPDEDIDLMATVILPPGMESVAPSGDDDEEATVILPAGQSGDTAPATGGRGAPGAQSPDEEDRDDEKTMIIRPPLPPEETEAESETPAGRAEPVKPAPAPPDPETAVDTGKPVEDEAEKTMALRSDPLGRTNKNKAAGPASSQPAGTGKPQTKDNTPSRDKEDENADPGIEDDETLVMHSNTYKPIKKRNS